MDNVLKIFIKCRILLLLTFIFSTLASALAQDPIPFTGTPVSGVNIHFSTGHEKDLDMIAAAGIKYIRTDLVWQEIEYARGKYNWEAYDELTSNLEKRGLKALYILDYSNSLYEDSVVSKDPITGETLKDIAAPVKAESIKAFSEWAAEAASRYKGKNIIWEIWNEPNTTFWRPAADIERYNALALSVISSVRRADPGAIIIGPATSQIPFGFIGSFLASGILKDINGLSVHPYRDYALAPESVMADYEKLKGLPGKYSAGKKRELPVISSEWGYASCKGGLTPERQAAYAVRMQLAGVMSGVPLSVWYDWKNDGESLTNFEHNCGTVSYDLTPKPAYNALKTMNEQLGEMTLGHRIETADSSDYVLLFTSRKGIFRLVAWTTQKQHEITLDATLAHTNGISAVDGYGKQVEIKTLSNGLVLELSELPCYITLPCGIRLQ
jgi:hypothetical protein